MKHDDLIDIEKVETAINERAVALENSMADTLGVDPAIIRGSVTPEDLLGKLQLNKIQQQKQYYFG